MSKRRMLTGGTGDVKPQFFTGTSGTAGAVDDYVVNELQLPVPRFGTQRNRATIFEILSLDWYIGIEDTDSAMSCFAFLTTSTNRSDGDTSTRATAVNDLNDPKTIGFAMYERQFTTSGASVIKYPIHIDLTDQSGNGTLIATDKITIVCGAVANSVGISAVCKIKYRMVNVGVQEYVGIVQSQQL